MKYIPKTSTKITFEQLKPGETFRFECSSGLAIKIHSGRGVNMVWITNGPDIPGFSPDICSGSAPVVVVPTEIRGI